MDKLITIPDKDVKKLKKIAIDAGMSFKKWIEHVILFQLK